MGVIIHISLRWCNNYMTVIKDEQDNCITYIFNFNLTGAQVEKSLLAFIVVDPQKTTESDFTTSNTYYLYIQ